MSLSATIGGMPKRTKITLVLSVIFAVAMLPPVSYIIPNSSSLWGGWAPMYVWIVFWSLWITGVFLYAAYYDAWGIAEDQIPPELRDTVPTTEAQSATDTGESDSEVSG